MTKLTYFMWIDEYDTNMSPKEQIEEYLRETCPLPTDDDLSKLEKEIFEELK